MPIPYVHPIFNLRPPSCLYELSNTISDQHEKLRSSVEARLDELTYVLSITQEERARLRLDMPDTLRQRMQHKGDR